MSKSSFIVINSKYRTRDSRSTSDFTFSIGQSLEVRGISVKSVSIPNIAYNINKNTQKLIVVKNGIELTLQLPIGQYDITKLISGLEAGLRALLLDGTLTVGITALTSRLFFTSTVPFQIKTGLTSPLSDILGATDFESNFPASPSTSFEIDGAVALSGIKNYFLVSQSLSSGFSGIFSNGQRLPLVTNIPIDTPYGTITHFEIDDSKVDSRVFPRSQNIQLIDIKIIDENGYIIDLNSHHVEIVCKVYHSNARNHI